MSVYSLINYFDGNISLDQPLITNYCIDMQISLFIYFYAKMGILGRYENIFTYLLPRQTENSVYLKKPRSSERK
jgi:hypothetical protein